VESGLDLESVLDGQQFIEVIVMSPVLRRANPLSDSCGSIKELLSMGSIHEEKDYSTDEEDESSDEQDSSYADEDDLLLDEVDLWSDEEASVDEAESVSDSIINAILKKTDSRDHIQGRGNRVIGTKHSSNKPFAEESRIANLLLSKRSARTNKNADTVIGTNLKKSDSLDHVKGRGQRVIKTTSSKNSSKNKNSSKSRKNKSLKDDPLMARFLDKSKQSGGASKNIVRQIFNSTNSLDQIEGKGRRVVRTRRVTIPGRARDGIMPASA
jgi:hypothetical protein